MFSNFYAIINYKMIVISFKNVEKLIFQNKEIFEILPEMKPLLNKWKFGVRKNIQFLIKKSLIEFLNTITQEQIIKLQNFLNQPITIEKLDNSLVKNINCNLEDLENRIVEFDHYQLCLYREKDLIFIMGWR